jgi:hypothetical protein
MLQLTAADAVKAAGLVLRRMPREHAAIVHSMSPQPELQFKYLKVHHPECKPRKPRSNTCQAAAGLTLL